MELKLKRIAKRDTYTIGRLYVDGEYACDTLEDAVRDVKIKHKTAIPAGRYNVTLNIQSPKFRTKKQYKFCDGYLPRLLDVPGYEGILIHIGNTVNDTSGCILVGRNTIVGQLTQSKRTFQQLYRWLKSATDTITIEIE